MTTLVFFLEEVSAKALLEGLLPRIVPRDGFQIRYVPFEGKQDLHKQLVRKMRRWRTPNTKFIVLRDQDAAACKEVKRQLVALCEEAGRTDALVRVACHEIESWYLGDLAAVESALAIRGLGGKQEKKKFRDPDALPGPSTELKQLTQGVYQKVSGSRTIGRLLDLEGSNRSTSFSAFLSGLTTLIRQQSPLLR